MRAGGQLPEGLLEEVEQHVQALEQRSGKRFGDRERPAARLGALGRGDLDAGDDGHDPQRRARPTSRSRASAERAGNRRFAYDSYRRLIQMYGETVDGIDGHRFEQELSRAEARARRRAGRRPDRGRPRGARRALQGDLRGGDRAHLRAGRARAARACGRGRLPVVGHAARAGLPARARDPGRPRHGRERRPDGLRQQGRDLRRRASRSRATPPPASRGSSASSSSTPRARTSSPASARPMPLARMEERAAGGVRAVQSTPPGASRSTTATCRTSSSRSRRARSTCSRRARRSARPRPRCKAAVDMVDEGLISREEAVARIDPASSSSCSTRCSTRTPSYEVVATGLNASPGAASGQVVFDADRRRGARRGGRERDPRPLGDDAGRHTTGCATRRGS